MVRTRGSAGVDVGLCSGGHWCGKNTKRCYRFTRTNKLKRNPEIRCTSGCYPKRCVNFDVCGVTTVSPHPGDFCHLCTYLLACKKIVPAPDGGECPVCYESHDTLYTFPMCGRHSGCRTCVRRILFGAVPPCGSSNYTHKVWDIISEDDRIITTNQECPMCRAKDARPFIEKFFEMEQKGKRAMATKFAQSARDLILQSFKAALSIARAPP